MQSNIYGKAMIPWKAIVNMRSTIWLIGICISICIIFLFMTSEDDITYQGIQTTPSLNKQSVKIKENLLYGVQDGENSAKEDLDNNYDGIKKEYPQQDENNAKEMQSQELENINRNINSYTPRSKNNIYKDNKLLVANWRNLSGMEIQSMSTLGRRLFLNEDIGTPSNNNFTILVWKYGPSLEPRFMYSYGTKKNNPFAHCSVKNCQITYKDEDLPKADAVLFHLHRMKGPPIDVPKDNSDQRWVWLSDESPHHTFMVAKDKNFSHYNDFFNWSMTYRMDADVPVPYGRTVPLPIHKRYSRDFDYLFDSRNKTIAVMASNCGGVNKRYVYVKNYLKKHINIDFYGGCGTLKCPGHFKKDCPSLKDYLFYIAFENGNCKHYITEKVFWNAISKNAVPIVMGPPKEQYQKILPPNSFIHVDDFSCIKDLADYITHLSYNKEAYLKYHEWRRNYEVLNEHGYLGAENFHYCRLCEALNYNSKEKKVYKDLYSYWNKKDHCYPANWIAKESKCDVS